MGKVWRQRLTLRKLVVMPFLTCLCFWRTYLQKIKLKIALHFTFI